MSRDPIAEYADHWFRHTAITIERPRWLDQTRESIANVARVRPGFDERLRNVALAALRSEDHVLVRRALAALAVVGAEIDAEAVRVLINSDDQRVADAAKTALFEINHGTV